VPELVQEFRSLFGDKPRIIASAPARLDFLNTHQDYKGLPVSSVGFELRTYVLASVNQDQEFRIASMNLKEENRPHLDRFPVHIPELEERGWFGNYLRASVKACQIAGFTLKVGMIALIWSEIPVASGLASSAALTTSFIKAIDHLFSFGIKLNQLAELAYEAENEILGIPCGRLDQYGCAYGGVIRIEMRPPFRVEQLPEFGGTFFAVDTGIRHSTAEIHPKRQEEINRALAVVRERSPSLAPKLGTGFSNASWEELSEEELLPYLKGVPKEWINRVLFTLRCNSSTEIAFRAMKGIYPNEEDLVRVLGEEWRGQIKESLSSGSPKLRLISLIMNYQHVLLRDLYEISLPEVERMRDSCLRAGALGVKISGAGMGGSLIGLAEDEESARKAVRAAADAGAARGWVAKVAKGVTSSETSP